MQKEKKPESATAFHACNDEASKHVVGIGNLRVLIMKEGNSWIAQGLEIDYFAAGPSIEGAKNAFQAGLTATVKEHLKVHGSIDKLLVIAPKEEWQAFFDATSYHVHSQVSVHELVPQLTQFAGITYIEPAAA